MISPYQPPTFLWIHLSSSLRFHAFKKNEKKKTTKEEEKWRSHLFEKSLFLRPEQCPVAFERRVSDAATTQQTAQLPAPACPWVCCELAASWNYHEPIISKARASTSHFTLRDSQSGFGSSLLVLSLGEEKRKKGETEREREADEASLLLSTEYFKTFSSLSIGTWAAIEVAKKVRD